MANRKFLIRVVTTSGDTTGFAEFANGSTDGGPVIPSYTTTQRNAITSIATGELVYNSDDSRLQIYNGSSWQVAAVDASSLASNGFAVAMAIAL